MKNVKVVSLSRVQVKPFRLEDFVEKENRTCVNVTISKKRLKKIATDLGLEYTHEQIEFTKKVMMAYKERL